MRTKVARLPPSFVLRAIGILGRAGAASMCARFVRAVAPERVRPIGRLANEGA